MPRAIVEEMPDGRYVPGLHDANALAYEVIARAIAFINKILALFNG